MHTNQIRSANRSAVRFGQTHGYQFDRDLVRLSADLDVLERNAHNDGMRLQLWACAQPYEGGTLRGTKVAEASIALGNVGEAQRFDAQTAAAAPTGARDYAMVLVLASDNEVHDYANYPARERFEGPQLEGAAGYAIEGGEVTMRVERIANTRPEGNVSGSLVLELRARPVDGAGIDADGVLLAQAAIECLHGDHALLGVERRATFTPPRAGRHQLSLELREWSFDRYVTRDWVSFDVPFVREAELRAVPGGAAKPAARPVSAPAPTAKVEAPKVETVEAPKPAAKVEAPKPAAKVEAPKPAAKVEAPKPAAKVEAPKPAAKVEAPKPAAKVEAPKPAAKVEAPKPAAKVEAPKPAAKVEAPKPAAKVEAPKPEARDLVSLNTASVEALSEVKGLNRKLAAAIVKARPFASVDDLVKVRGVGPRMVKSLRELITL